MAVRLWSPAILLHEFGLEQGHQTKKGNKWHFGLMARIAGDAGSSLVYAVISSTASAIGVAQASALVHRQGRPRVRRRLPR